MEKGHGLPGIIAGLMILSIGFLSLHGGRIDSGSALPAIK
jgi:hypothetical protein